MYQFGNLWDFLLEESECVGVGHHDGSNVVAQ